MYRLWVLFLGTVDMLPFETILFGRQHGWRNDGPVSVWGQNANVRHDVAHKCGAKELFCGARNEHVHPTRPDGDGLTCSVSACFCGRHYHLHRIENATFCTELGVQPVGVDRRCCICGQNQEPQNTNQKTISTVSMRQKSQIWQNSNISKIQ